MEIPVFMVRRECIIAYGLIVIVAGLFVACPNGTTPEDPVAVDSISYNGGLPIKVLADTGLVTSVGTPVVSPSGATGSFSITEGELPKGLAFNSGTGAITGTPTTPNGDGVKITIQFTASGDYTGTATTSVTIIVQSKIDVTGIIYNDGKPIICYVGIKLDSSIGIPTITPENATGTFVITSASLPVGLSLDGSTGEITGTPTLPYPDGIEPSIKFEGSGIYEGSAVVTSVKFIVSSKTPIDRISYNNDQPAVVYATTEIDSTVGIPTITPEGATGTFSIPGRGLPEGLAINTSTGEITGIPTTPTTEAVEVTIQFEGDGEYDGSVTTTFSIKVEPIPDEGIPVTGIQYNGGAAIRMLEMVEFNDPAGMPTHSQTGATGTYSIKDGTLPGGVTIDSSTGVIAGTPTLFDSDGSTVTVQFEATAPYSGTVETSVVLKVLHPIESIAYTPNPWSIYLPSSETTNSVDVVPNGATGAYSFVTGDGVVDPKIVGGVSLASDGRITVNGFLVRSIGTFKLKIKLEGTGDYGGVAYSEVELTTELLERIDSVSWKPDSTAFVSESNTPSLILWERKENNSFEPSSVLPTSIEDARYEHVQWGNKTNRILASRGRVVGFDLWHPNELDIWQFGGSFPEEGGDNPYTGDTTISPVGLAWSQDETTVVSQEAVTSTATNNPKLRFLVWRWNGSRNNFVLAQTIDYGDYVNARVGGLTCAPDGMSFGFLVEDKPVLFKWDEGKSEYVEATSPFSSEFLATVNASSWNRDLSALAVATSGSIASNIISIWSRGEDDSFVKKKSGSVPHTSISSLLVSLSTDSIAYKLAERSIYVFEWDDSAGSPSWKEVDTLSPENSFTSWSWSPDGTVFIGAELQSHPKFLFLE